MNSDPNPYRLNLPATAFPARANAAVREVGIQQFWAESRVYEKCLAKRSSSPRFLLHDGPPYLSAPTVHMGTALNKVLKDFVTKHKSMRGFYTPFVPGFDGHGLPIENAALKEMSAKSGQHAKATRSTANVSELRGVCRAVALRNLEGQTRAFQRLGVWGDFAKPYVTIDKEFEGAQLRVFAEMVAHGLVYRGERPVHWCPTCSTCLADAEVETSEKGAEQVCWRCRTAVETRVMKQWFASVDACREQALQAVDQVEWLPKAGRNRISAMVKDRGDWCVSRQRSWGVPIPAFYCNDCGDHLLTQESVALVASVFEAQGSDCWWDEKLGAEHFLGSKAACPGCGCSSLRKETDTMDVWFDSGVTHAAVVDLRPELRGSPSELYLEGSDQHRGWFQSSLWTSVAVTGRAPFKTVLTHGFVVDEKGRKMSKSVGNVVDPEAVMKQYGADVLRLWVASVDYTADTPCGNNLLTKQAKVYEKLRNTLRFLLGNLGDFDFGKDAVPADQLGALDSYLLHRLAALVRETAENFEKYEFFKFYQSLLNFLTTDLSACYLDAVKDRLYTHAANAESRRSAQTVLHHVLHVLVRLLAPVTPHLAEEVWQLVRQDGEESVLLLDYPDWVEEFRNGAVEERMRDVFAARSTGFKALELAREKKLVGKTQEAEVVLVFSEDAKQIQQAVLGLGDEAAGVFMVSQLRRAESAPPAVEQLSLASQAGVHAYVLKAAGKKCARCWNYRQTVGTLSHMPEVCSPCAATIETAA